MQILQISKNGIIVTELWNKMMQLESEENMGWMTWFLNIEYIYSNAIIMVEEI